MKRKTIITFIGIIPLLIMAYIGQLYISLGNQTESVVTIGIWTVILGLLFFGAYYGRSKTGAYSESWNIMGWIFAGLFLICGAYYFVPRTAHFMYVNGGKYFIRNRIDSKLQQMDAVFDAYKNQSVNRADKLYQDIKISLTDADFKKVYPNQSRDVQFATTQQNTFEQLLIDQQYYDMLNNWNDVVREQIQDKLVDNWNIFMAPENVNISIKTITDNKNLLEKKFSVTNPVEQFQGVTPEFSDANVLSDIETLKEEFTNKNGISIFGIILAIILLLLSCSSFVFIQRDRIKKIKNNPVFDEGHNYRRN